jgi:heptosyltransferase-1
MRILIVKTSSLGDLVHALPALTDAARALPGLRCDWLAEKSFAEIPRWHPAVDRIVTCEMRRWRKQLWRFSGGGEWAAFKQQLRERDYDLVIDAQGLVKSAWLASKARGPLAGPDWHGAREPLASLLYRYKLPVPHAHAAHAVRRGRVLFAEALGYAVPEDLPDFGLDRTRFAAPSLTQPYVVFLHATTWPSKCWPESHWCELGRWLVQRGIEVVLPWGSDAERASAQRIADGCGARLLPKLSLTEIAGVLAHAQAAVGVDTGLAHIANAVGTASVTLYGPTLPGLTGTIGRGQLHLCSTDAATVDRARPNLVTVQGVQEALQRPEFNV